MMSVAPQLHFVHHSAVCTIYLEAIMTMTIVSFYIDFSKMFKEWFANIDVYRGLSHEEKQDLMNW